LRRGRSPWPSTACSRLVGLLPFRDSLAVTPTMLPRLGHTAASPRSRRLGLELRPRGAAATPASLLATRVAAACVSHFCATSLVLRRLRARHPHSRVALDNSTSSDRRLPAGLRRRPALLHPLQGGSTKNKLARVSGARLELHERDLRLEISGPTEAVRSCLLLLHACPCILHHVLCSF
jgi:hypothetical protein